MRIIIIRLLQNNFTQINKRAIKLKGSNSEATVNATSSFLFDYQAILECRLVLLCIL